MAMITIRNKKTGEIRQIPESAFTGEAPSQSQKGGFNLASLLPILGSIGGGILGTPLGPAGIVGGAALGGGGGEALRQGFSGEEADVGNVLREGALGGGGSLLGLGIGRFGGALLGKGGRAAAKAGAGLRKGVIKPKVNASPFAAREEAELVSTAGKLGLKGSAGAQRGQSVKAFEELSKQIKTGLQGVKVDKTGAVNSVSQKIRSSINFDAADKSLLRAEKLRLGQVAQAASKGGPGVFAYKQELGNQLSRAFTKLEKGVPLTAQEEVAMSTWQALDDVLAKAAPGVKALTLNQSALYKLAPGLQQSAQQGVRLPFGIGGIPGVSPAIQGTQDLAGRALQGGIPTPSIPGAGGLATAGAGQAGIRAMFPGGEEIAGQVQSAEGQFAPEDMTAIEAAAQEEPASPIDEDLTFMGRPVTRAQLVGLMLENPKQAKLIQQVFEFENPQLAGGKKVDSNIQKELLKIGNAESIANRLERQFKAIGSTGRGVGQARGLFSELTGADPNVRAYEANRQASIGPLARAISSEVGVLTDQDIKRAERMLPKLTDTAEEARLKIANLREAIRDRRELLKTIGSTTGGTSSSSSEEATLGI